MFQVYSSLIKGIRGDQVRNEDNQTGKRENVDETER